DRRHSRRSDDNPLEGAVAVVRVEAEDPLDPIAPHERQDEQRNAHSREREFEPHRPGCLAHPGSPSCRATDNVTLDPTATASVGTLSTCGRLLRGRRPPDVMCKTRTLAATGAAATISELVRGSRGPSA